MAFFPQLPDTSRPEPTPADEHRLIERDEVQGDFPGELGTPVSLPGCVLEFDQMAFALDQFLVYQPGFVATLRVAHRDPVLDDHDKALRKSLFGPPDDVVFSERFLWGLEFDNERRGFGVRLDGVSPDFEITPKGGGGDAAISAFEFWVHAVPRSVMRFYVAWPARDIPETGLTVDASPIQTAAQRDTRVSSWRS